MTNTSSELSTTGKAEIGYDPDNSEVYLQHAGEKYYMQPDEARQMANLLMQSAKAAEDNTNAAHIVDLEVTNDPDMACPDCGKYIGRFYGPVNFDGERTGDGDYVCRGCAQIRGVEVSG